MYSTVIAFGLASLMLCIGLALRGKIKFFQKTLMPVSVIGGVIGFIFVNLVIANFDLGGVTTGDFSSIVDVFFVMSFISIGLTGGRKKKQPKTDEEKKAAKSNGPVKGAMGMGLIWCMLYAITPVIGIAIIALIRFTGCSFPSPSAREPDRPPPTADCSNPPTASRTRKWSL